MLRLVAQGVGVNVGQGGGVQVAVMLQLPERLGADAGLPGDVSQGPRLAPAELGKHPALATAVEGKRNDGRQRPPPPPGAGCPVWDRSGWKLFLHGRRRTERRILAVRPKSGHNKLRPFWIPRTPGHRAESAFDNRAGTAMLGRFAMKTQIMIPHFALLLGAFGFGAPAKGKDAFELSPSRSETDPKQLRLMADYLEGLESVKPMPETHGCVARLIVAADKGDLDISLCAPLARDGTEERGLIIVRVRERLDAAFGVKRGWCVPLDLELGNELCRVTQAILGRTSHVSGVSAVAGQGSQFDFSSSLLAGTCYSPPKDSHVGELAEIWLGLAEWCAMGDAFRTKASPLWEKVKDLQRVVDGLDETLVIPKPEKMFDDDKAPWSETVSGNQAIESLLSK